MLVYIIAVFLLTWIPQIVAVIQSRRLKNAESSHKPPSQTLLGVIMFVPSLTLLGFIALRQIPLDLAAFGLTTPNIAGLILGFSVPIIYMAVLFIVLRPFSEIQNFSLTEGGMWHIKRRTIFDNFSSSAKKIKSKKPVVYIIDLFITVLVFVTFITFPALGEELAWRGYMQPILVERFGVTLGILLIGIIWGLWHIPANLAGHNDEDNPKLNAFVFFLLQTVSMSFVLGGIRIVTGNIWPVAVAHATHNVMESMFIKTFLVPRIGNVKYRTIETAVYMIFGVIGFLLVYISV